MKFFDKIKPGRGTSDGQQELTEELLEKAAISERFRKLIMVDPESALKVYPLSDYEFDAVVLGTLLMQHAMKSTEGKKEESDHNVYVLGDHLRRTAEMDIQELQMSLKTKVARILDELNDLNRMLKNLGNITLSFFDDEQTLFQKKSKVFLKIDNAKCNHEQVTLTQDKKRDTLFTLNDLFTLIPYLEEIKQRGTCEICGCKLGKLDIAVISEAKIDDTLRSR
jgi:hypothetical protein